jgi:hypothetical protein
MGTLQKTGNCMECSSVGTSGWGGWGAHLVHAEARKRLKHILQVPHFCRHGRVNVWPKKVANAWSTNRSLWVSLHSQAATDGRRVLLLRR